MNNYLFYLNGDKQTHTDRNISGAQVRAKLPEESRGYQIYLECIESENTEYDRLFNDDNTVSLERPRSFYSVPNTDWSG